MALLRPIQGETAMKFWSSSNICNRLKAICAYSLDKEDANKNLARFGYTNAFRKKVLECEGITFNHPLMENIPYNNGDVPIWVCLNVPVKGHWVKWSDVEKWLDQGEWVEFIRE